MNIEDGGGLFFEALQIKNATKLGMIEKNTIAFTRNTYH